MLTGLTNLGSLASRLLLAVLAVLLGWLAPLHAGGPSPVATDDAPTIQLPAVAPSPVVQVFLVAYRGQGPPVLVFVPIGGGPAFAAGVDALYSPQAVTNEAGQVVERYSYVGAMQERIRHQIRVVPQGAGISCLRLLGPGGEVATATAATAPRRWCTCGWCRGTCARTTTRRCLSWVIKQTQPCGMPLDTEAVRPILGIRNLR